VRASCAAPPSTGSSSSAPWVGIDDRAAARQPPTPVELGHRRVAVVAFGEDAPDARPLGWDLTTARVEGYRTLLRTELVVRGSTAPPP
jgi:hypothetical protein